MAYFLTYYGDYSSKITELMRLEIYRKDIAPANGSYRLKIEGIKHQYLEGQGDKFDCIIPSELTATIFVSKADVDNGVDFSNFIIEYDQEWLVKLFSDGIPLFEGFLTPGEGEADFLDHGYSINLSATDGLGFLKQQAFSTFDAGVFTGVHTFYDIIAHCLSQTGIDLDLHVRANIFHASMVNRTTNSSKDFLQQSGWHYRSLLKDATTFNNCFDILEKILKGWATFYQWRGVWVINSIQEMQKTVGPQGFYTLYTNGVPTGEPELNTNAIIGRQEKLHPINVNQRISARFPIKSVTDEWLYEVWPEVPANNKFEHGTLSVLYSGSNFTATIVDHWTYLDITGPSTISALPAALSVADDPAFRKSTYDEFGIETKRELALYKDGSAGARWFQSESVPVKINGKLEIRFDVRTEFDISGAIQMGVMAAYIQPPTGPRISLRFNASLPEGQWITQPGTGADLAEIRAEWSSDENTTEFKSVTVTSSPIQVEGDLYFAFIHPAGVDNQFVFFTGFEVTYRPFTAGGYREIKGDYWFTSQDRPFKDVVSVEDGISDSMEKIFKYAIYGPDLIHLTDRQWYRDYNFYTNLEKRHFRELINLSRFNHGHRRMWRLTGTFGGTKHSPVSDPTIYNPLGFHQHFAFKDAPELAGHYFMLVPPLVIDYGQGEFQGTFVEALRLGFNIEIGNTMRIVLAGIINTIDTTTELEWDGAGMAPPPGTNAFPPYIGFIPDQPNQLLLGVPLGTDVSLIADPNGAGNSPSFTIVSFSDDAINRTLILQVGSDIEIGNRFIIEIFGVQRVFEVVSQQLFTDGNLEGDTHKFSYKF